uniref:Uncharacterized protein n=1 Tax=Rhizophora mucronata TaxID=61149 RepID=A0A2P2L4X8_RHIMU
MNSEEENKNHKVGFGDRRKSRVKTQDQNGISKP